VRNNQGAGTGNLLERNAQIPAAPTQGVYERRPAFPYLEAGRARINSSWDRRRSLTMIDADVALWQDSEIPGARASRPRRAHGFNLTDTGLLQINATWQRASACVDPGVHYAMAEWQLGQITKLLSGKDGGWRAE